MFTLELSFNMAAAMLHGGRAGTKITLNFVSVIGGIRGVGVSTVLILRFLRYRTFLGNVYHINNCGNYSKHFQYPHPSLIIARWLVVALGVV